MNKKSSIGIIIAMLIMAFTLFLLDIFLSNNILISSFYVLIILMSLWINDDRITVGATIASVILIFLAYFTNSHGIIWNLIINKFLSVILLIITSFIITDRKGIESELKRSAETLELRVLARTTAAEARSKRLEQQIKVLQIIRQNSTESAFNALDEVIQNLKDLSSTDKDK
jgi:hypothetical protein